jgi:hypothetical protein
VPKKHPFFRCEDTYGIGVEDEVRYNNILCESINGIKINADFIDEVEID